MTHNNIISNQYVFYNKLTNDIITNVTKVEKLSMATDQNSFNFGTITAVNDGVTTTYTAEQYIYTNQILTIPGIGYAYCGDVLYIEQYRKKPQAFQLNFGWHENVSNQKIYSWHLMPLKCDYTVDTSALAKTLYYTDLSNIIAVENQIPGFIPTDLGVVS